MTPAAHEPSPRFDDFLSRLRLLNDELEAFALSVPRSGNGGSQPLVGDFIECVLASHLGPAVADLELLRCGVEPEHSSTRPCVLAS